MTFEITEGALMADQDRAMRTVAGLRDLGVRLAIDDFGTGCSSLAYLARLAVDEVKIDRSFISGLGADQSAAAIVRATLDLAHALGFSVVGEGVEDEFTREQVTLLGIEGMQGYLISRPMDARSVPGWLAERAGVSAQQGFVALQH